MVLRISEAHDLGKISRYALYEAMKTILATPPDVKRINAKYIGHHHAVNVSGVVITTNYTDGLYLPGDDGRHYVAGTEITRDDFPADFWRNYWSWYTKRGGLADVVAYLATYDLGNFDAKAPPRQTEAFWQMVDTGTAPEVPELADALDGLGNPPAVTITMVLQKNHRELNEWLRTRENRRAIPHRFASCDYLPVHNTNAKSGGGMWLIGGTRQMVYAQRKLAPAKRVEAVQALKAEEDHKMAERIKQAREQAEQAKREGKRTVLPFKP